MQYNNEIVYPLLFKLDQTAIKNYEKSEIRQVPILKL